MSLSSKKYKFADGLAVTDTVQFEALCPGGYRGVTFTLISKDQVDAVALDVADSAAADTDRFTFLNYTFTGKEGATIRISGSESNDGDFVVDSVVSAHVAQVSESLTDETFGAGVTVTVIRTEDPLVGSWSLEASNNYSTGLIDGGMDEGDWGDLTQAFSPSIDDVTEPSNQPVQLDPFDFDAVRVRFNYTDGIGMWVYNSATDAMEALVASAGSLPIDAAGNRPKSVVTWRERLWWYRLPLEPANWFASAKADGTDYDYDRPFNEETQAVAGNENGVLSDTGLAPGPITALIPFSQAIMLFGLDDQILMLADDPMAGGRFDLVTTQVGIAYGKAWCRDASGTLFFMSSRGSLYKYAPGALPERVSQPITELIEGTIDFSNTLVSLAWNEREHGFYVFISPTAGGVTYNFFYDAFLQGWWKDVYATSTMQPFVINELLGFTAAERVVLLGSQDGYVRYIDPSANTDDGVAIASEVYVGPIKGKDGQPGIITDLQCVLGASSGNVAWRLYAGDSAQTALSTSTDSTGTFVAGRNRSPNRPCHLRQAVVGPERGVAA